MSKAEIIEKAPLSMVDLKAEMAAIQKRDGELSFRAGKTHEYVNSFSVMSKAAYTDLKKKIESLEVPRLKEDHVVKIIDLMPVSVNDLSMILSGYALTVTKENMQKIVDAVAEHRK